MANYDKVPELMKGLPNWVCFRLEKRGDRMTKIPYNPKTGSKAKSTDPATWGSFGQAVKVAEASHFDGVGFMLTNSPIVGVDLDHCLENGKPNAYADYTIRKFKSYTEISPSGEGIHILMIGNIPDNKGRRNSRVEVYPSGRFLTVTGNVYGGYEKLTTPQKVLDALVSKIDEERGQKQPQGEAQPARQVSAEEERLTLPDTDLIAQIYRSKTGQNFAALYDEGDLSAYQGDQSSADMALMNMLTWWTNGNREQMERIFSNSALGAREKWQKRPDYRRRTIDRALQSWNGKGYTPRGRKPKKKPTGAGPDGEKTDHQGMNWPRILIGHMGATVPDPAAWENLDYLLKKLGITARKNILTKKLEIKGQGLDRVTLDTVAVRIQSEASRYGLKLKLSEILPKLWAIGEMNQYSAVRDYLTECRKNWDGSDQLEKMWRTLELAPQSAAYADFVRSLFVKALIQAVVMAYNDGTKSAQGVLILIGPQGIGKTTFIKRLSPVASWVLEGLMLDPRNKDDLTRATCAWLAELGELNGTIRRDRVNDLKNFITLSVDYIRLPYKMAMENWPRLTVYIGTTNDDKFLKDDTGNRRFWPIALTAIHELPEDFNLSQFWGQLASMAIDQKIPYWLNREEQGTLAQLSRPYEQPSAEEQALLDRLAWDAPRSQWVRRTSSELCEKLSFPRNRNAAMGRALRKLSRDGHEVMPPTNNHGKYFTVPPFEWEAADFRDGAGRYGDGTWNP